MDLWLAPVTVWTGREIIDRGAILIRDGKIVAVLPAEDASSFDADAPAERIDGSGKLAIPGLVNAHTHLYSSLARGMPFRRSIRRPSRRSSNSFGGGSTRHSIPTRSAPAPSSVRWRRRAAA